MQDVNSFQRVPTDSLLQNIERLNNAIDEAYKNRGKKEREVVKETILREKMKLLVTPEVYKAAEIEEKRCNNSGKSFNFLEQCQLQESVSGGLGKGKFYGGLNSNQIDGVCNTMVGNNAMVSNKPVSPHRPTSPNSLNFNRGGKIEKKGREFGQKQLSQAVEQLQRSEGSNQMTVSKPPARQSPIPPQFQYSQPTHGSEPQHPIGGNPKNQGQIGQTGFRANSGHSPGPFSQQHDSQFNMLQGNNHTFNIKRGGQS